jgi:CheY-like chemotaxis protein
MHTALKVLIVDDNAIVRSQIASIVKGRALEVLECSDGMDALGEYSVHRPDWVLMDVDMKKMDGLTATSLIHHYFPKAKVLIVSQEGTPHMKEAALKVGASAFVTKDNLPEILNYLHR